MKTVSRIQRADEERLIGCEAGRIELGDLVPKMSLKLINVAAVDRRGFGDISL